MVRGDMTPAELVRNGIEAGRQIRAGAAPEGLRVGLNDDLAAQTRTPLQKVTRTLQTPARTIDLMTRTAIYLQRVAEGSGEAEAVRSANEAMSSLHTLSPFEQHVVSRAMPIYPWAKAVANAAAQLGADHPASVLWAMHLGDLAGRNPQQFNPGYLAEELNPLGIFENPASMGSFLNPILRGAMGAGLGVKPSSSELFTPVTQPNGSRPVPWLGNPAGAAYYAANQLPIGKLILQSPLSGHDQTAARYDTGQPREYKGNTLPALRNRSARSPAHSVPTGASTSPATRSRAASRRQVPPLSPSRTQRRRRGMQRTRRRSPR